MSALFSKQWTVHGEMNVILLIASLLLLTQIEFLLQSNRQVFAHVVEWHSLGFLLC